MGAAAPAAAVPAAPPPAGFRAGALFGVAQAVLVTGCVVTGVLAQKRRKQAQDLNGQLREMNKRLREQVEWADVRERDIRAVISGFEATPATVTGADDGSGSLNAASLDDLMRQAQSEEFAESEGDEMARSLRRGKELLREGKSKDALTALTKGLDFALSLGNQEAVRSALKAQARAYRNLGDTEKCLELLYRSVGVSLEMEEDASRADTYGEIGDILVEKGDMEGAAEFYDKAIIAMDQDEPSLNTYDVDDRPQKF